MLLHPLALVSAAALAVLIMLGLAPCSAPQAAPAPPCDGFDFPVGAPDGVGYHDAQPFGTNDHLGNDWNGDGGGNSDLGDPVSSIAAGIVTEVADHGGSWGQVVRVVHRGCRDAAEVESLYAHLERVDVVAGEVVARGQHVGSIGTAGGTYPAHLHLELRDRAGLPLGPGYGRDLPGYLDATRFIRAHRPVAPASSPLLGRVAQ